MKKIFLALFVLAGVSGFSQAANERFACNQQAGANYKSCREDADSAGEKEYCRKQFDKEKDACSSSYGYQSERFEPVRIPQRPVYILPGSR